MRNTEQSLKLTPSGEVTKVVSYSTHVADIKAGKLLIYGWYSQTTSKHLNQLVSRLGLEKVELTKNDKPQEDNGSGMMAMAGMMADLSSIFCDTQKESNDWKKRMLQAGLPGLSIPEDWDLLSESEKETRLNNVIELSKNP